VILKTARAHAAFEGRTTITARDIAIAAELTLPHRLKHTPFQQASATMEELAERIEQLQGRSTQGDPQETPAASEERESQKKK
jgi:Mg-chelatase subunit ChlI